LRFMLMYSPRWLFLIPGAVMMLIGLLVGAWLMPGPQRVGSITFDVHTMLYAGLAVLTGFQSVVFAVFTKTFAITSGLLPKDERMTKLFKYITLETGLVVGVLLILAGLGGTAAAVLGWQKTQFGPLVPADTLRTVIPSFVLLALGCQTVLASFFMSVLGLQRR